MTNKFLVVKLDQYAGNVDELVSAALTGYGSDRYGEKQAAAVFKEKVVPLLENKRFPLGFRTFNTEYGSMPYEVDFPRENNLRLGIDSNASKESIEKAISIWDKAYGDDEGKLVISVDNIHNQTVTIKVLGFDLIEVKEIWTTIR